MARLYAPIYAVRGTPSLKLWFRASFAGIFGRGHWISLFEVSCGGSLGVAEFAVAGLASLLHAAGLVLASCAAGFERTM